MLINFLAVNSKLMIEKVILFIQKEKFNLRKGVYRKRISKPSYFAQYETD